MRRRGKNLSVRLLALAASQRAAGAGAASVRLLIEAAHRLAQLEGLQAETTKGAR